MKVILEKAKMALNMPLTARKTKKIIDKIMPL